MKKLIVDIHTERGIISEEHDWTVSMLRRFHFDEDEMRQLESGGLLAQGDMVFQLTYKCREVTTKDEEYLQAYDAIMSELGKLDVSHPARLAFSYICERYIRLYNAEKERRSD